MAAPDTRRPADGGADLRTVVQLWGQRWGVSDATYLDQMQAVLSDCVVAGLARICVLRSADTPVAAIAVLHDPPRRTAAYLISGFEPRFAALSPGTAVLLMAIRNAIETGCSRFDFLRGAEPQKARLGGKPGWNRNYTLRRNR